MILSTIIFNELWGHMIHVHKSAKIWNLKVDFETVYSIEILQNHIRKLIVQNLENHWPFLNSYHNTVSTVLTPPLLFNLNTFCWGAIDILVIDLLIEHSSYNWNTKYIVNSFRCKLLVYIKIEHEKSNHNDGCWKLAM